MSALASFDSQAINALEAPPDATAGTSRPLSGEPSLRANGRAFAQIAQYHPELTAFRRDLHAHPELGFEEVYTSARVAEALKLCGLDEIQTGIGRTGVVGVIRGKRTASRRMVALRADM